MYWKGFALLASLDYAVFFVTNQAGLAEGLISRADFDTINRKVLEFTAPSGIKITETFVCPHGEDSDCERRKPKPGMLKDAAKKYGVALVESWMVGDRATDIQTGVNAGSKTILVQSGSTLEAPDADYIAPNFLDAVQCIAAHS